jgi:hypothetical protein
MQSTTSSTTLTSTSTTTSTSTSTSTSSTTSTSTPTISYTRPSSPSSLSYFHWSPCKVEVREVKREERSLLVESVVIDYLKLLLLQLTIQCKCTLKLVSSLRSASPEDHIDLTPTPSPTPTSTSTSSLTTTSNQKRKRTKQSKKRYRRSQQQPEKKQTSEELEELVNVGVRKGYLRKLPAQMPRRRRNPESKAEVLNFIRHICPKRIGNVGNEVYYRTCGACHNDAKESIDKINNYKSYIAAKRDFLTYGFLIKKLDFLTMIELIKIARKEINHIYSFSISHFTPLRTLPLTFNYPVPSSVSPGLPEVFINLPDEVLNIIAEYSERCTSVEEDRPLSDLDKLRVLHERSSSHSTPFQEREHPFSLSFFVCWNCGEHKFSYFLYDTHDIWNFLHCYECLGDREKLEAIDDFLLLAPGVY